MKKTFRFLAVLSVAFLLCQQASAQSYRTAGGLFIDFGEGSTFVGPAVKHSLNGPGAIQGMVLFGNHVTALGLEYSYNKRIPGAPGLDWNLGLGAQGLLAKNNSDFLLRPIAGIEYTIPAVPFNIGFDWRPAFRVTHGTDFTAARFGIALRYVFAK